MAQIIPNVKIRQMITGFLFGSVGASIALSPIGKVSGAHINPAVTMVFWLFRKLEGRLAITYILAQLGRYYWLLAPVDMGPDGEKH